MKNVDNLMKKVHSLWRQGREKDMKPLLLEAINICRLEDDKLRLIELLNDYGGCLRNLGEFKEAELSLKEALSIFEKNNIEDKVAYATSIMNLANIYREEKDYFDAEKYFLKSKEIFDSISDKSYSYIGLLNNFSLFYRETNNYQNAEKLQLEAIDLLKNDNKFKVPLAISYNNLYEIQKLLKKDNSCLDNLLKAEKILLEETGENHPLYASVLNNLADYKFSHKEYKESLSLYKKSLDIVKSCYGEKSESYLSVLNNVNFVEDFINTLEINSDNFDINSNISNNSTLKNGSNMKNGFCNFSSSLEDNINLVDNSSYSLENNASSLDNHSGYLKSNTNLVDNSSNSLKNYSDLDNNFSACLEKTFYTNNNLPNFSNKKSRLNGLEKAEFVFGYASEFLKESFPDIYKRSCFALVGTGSECLGFDDKTSEDHDFLSRCQLFLTDSDYNLYQESLNKAFKIFTSSLKKHLTKNNIDTDVVGNIANIIGNINIEIFSISSFYKYYTLFEDGPKTEYEYRKVPMDLLCVATNGKVFMDNLGEFSKIRNRLLKFYPEDIRLKKIAYQLNKMAQSGQYNYNRMIKRNDIVAANIAQAEFINHYLNLVHLLNKKYMPFYKWAYKNATYLPILGEFTKNKLRNLSEVSIYDKSKVIEEICCTVVFELNRLGYSNSKIDFLTYQAEEVRKQISDKSLREEDSWIE